MIFLHCEVIRVSPWLLPSVTDCFLQYVQWNFLESIALLEYRKIASILILLLRIFFFFNDENVHMTTNATIKNYKTSYITTMNKIQLLGKGNNKERKTTGKGESHHHHFAEPNTLKSFEHYSPINKQKVVEVVKTGVVSGRVTRN